MTRSSDLVPLLAAENAGAGVGFRQGTIIAFDNETAVNLVQVGNSLLENLPILNTSEASLLVPGDVVGILTSGSSWAIMGRLVIPGTPEAASSIRSITNRIQAAEDGGNGYRTSTAWGDLLGGANVGPSVTMRIGSSGRALCFWSCELGQTLNSTGATIDYVTRNTPHVGIQVSGASTVAAVDGNALNINLEHPGSGTTGFALTSFWLQAAMMHLFTGLNAGMTTFTMKYRHDNLVPSTDRSYFNSRELAVFAL